MSDEPFGPPAGLTFGSDVVLAAYGEDFVVSSILVAGGNTIQNLSYGGYDGEQAL